MRKALLFQLLISLFSINLMSQVSINNDGSAADPSAMLEVKSDSKGLLVPRVSLTAANEASPVTSPATGLLVYNLATSGIAPNSVTPGFYYWNCTRWIPVIAPQGNAVGDMLYWNGSQWVQVPAGQNGQVLTMNNGVPTWGGVQLPMVTTSLVTHVTSGTAVSGGTVTYEGGSPVLAKGVCCSLTPFPDTSGYHTHDNTTIGSIFVSHPENLQPNRLYYIRAYAVNSAGVGYGAQLTFQTLPSCGRYLVNHVAGEVAPVNKTVNYYTINAVPGEPAKCWTIQNLGSSHPAESSTDSTEASAGWYWQFNSKRGYMATPTSCTPAWGNFGSNYYDWLPYNDPCRLEMGNPWRVPTQTEWTNVKVAGGWSNPSGPWNSHLYLHTAGLINNNSLLQRAETGYYWTGTGNYWSAFALCFYSNYCEITGNPVQMATPLRCIKDSCSVYIPTSVSITTPDDTICTGMTVTFTATPVNGGQAPVYQWKVQGSNIGTNSPTLSYAPSNGDVVTCEMTSDLTCTVNPVVSNSIAMTVFSSLSYPYGTQHIATPTEITWNWSQVSNAMGYKWNTVDDYSTALDMGTATSFTEHGLTPQTYYLRYIWAYNLCSYSPVNAIAAYTSQFTIGLNYGGGVVFYIDGTGQHGLIAAQQDQGTAAWGCYGTSIGGTFVQTGTGQANTLAIINGCSVPNTAARICNDLILNGYNDWFLPSQDELNLMYQQRTTIGNFLPDFYWCSSEFNANNAWTQEFSNGNQYNFNKNYETLRVRAVRAF